MLEQENLADKELVVGSIRVLGSMTGGGTEKVRENLDRLQNVVKAQQNKENDYWTGLTADGVISAVEKKQLKKEFESIEQTYTALTNQAEAKGVDESDEVVLYKERYNELREYLYTTLQLFKRMSENTKIESAEVFNGYYNRYYFALQNAQSRVNIGESGKIRVLSSLTELGTDGEVVLFEDNFYMYDLANHEWIGISVASKVGEYTGVRTDSPPQVLNQYFLVGPDGIVEDYLEFIPETRAIEENAWTDEKGNIIYINYGFEPGYIYFWNERNEFEKVEDKNNWRYIVAMNDMLACGFPISPTLAAWLSIDLPELIAPSIEQKVKDHTAKYSRVNDVPENPNDGDWILWDASSTARFVKGHLYVYQKATVEWIELNPRDTSGQVRDKFMRALTDILEVNPTETGYFSTVFASAFFGATATLDQISTREIELRDSGSIRSRGYVAGIAGFNIQGNGKAEFSDIKITKGYPTKEEYDKDMAQQAAENERLNQAVENAQADVDKAGETLVDVISNYIAEVDVEYALGDSETEAPDTGWQTTAPEYVPGMFMWQRTKIIKGIGKSEYSEPTCISGARGNSVNEFIEQYIMHTSQTEPPADDADWINFQPELESGKYLWTRTKMIWEDETVTYSEKILAAALDQVFTDVIKAQKDLADAKTVYDEAIGNLNNKTDETEGYLEKIAQLSKSPDGSLSAKLYGEIIQDMAAGDNDLAISTAGFSFDGTRGFAVTKKGNLYANNGVFRGTVYATNGTLRNVEITGTIKIGTPSYGVYIGSADVEGDGLYARRILNIGSAYMHGCTLEDGKNNFWSIVECRYYRYDGNKNRLYNSLRAIMPYYDELSDLYEGVTIANGFINYDERSLTDGKLYNHNGSIYMIGIKTSSIRIYYIANSDQQYLDITSSIGSSDSITIKNLVISLL